MEELDFNMDLRKIRKKAIKGNFFLKFAEAAAEKKGKKGSMGFAAFLQRLKTTKEQRKVNKGGEPTRKTKKAAQRNHEKTRARTPESPLFTEEFETWH